MIGRYLVMRTALWFSLAVVCGLVLGSAVGIKTKTSDKSPAGFYRGSGTARRVANLNVATLTCDYNSDFWFTVNTQGTVEGYATVMYQLSFDDAYLRSVIALANSAYGKASGFALSGVRGLSDVLDLSSQKSDIVGTTTRYDELVPVREGKIKGHVTGGTLRLEWATAPPVIPYTNYTVHGIGEKVRRQATGPAYSPWIADARLIEAAPGQWQGFVTGEAAHKTSGNIQTFAFWTAHRVAAGE